MTAKPHFTDIRKQIIKELKKAKENIKIAVCWFTNEELFNLLCEKLQSGINVELIILDDYINANPYGCDFNKFINLGGNLFLGNVEYPMHNKYCIIDNVKLINGSYNWTYYAETKNEENIIILENCNDLIMSFSNDFDRLKAITIKSDVFKGKSLLEFENARNEDKRLNVFSSFNLLSNDLFLKAIATKNKSYYQAAKSITPDNIYFQKEAIKLNWDEEIILNTTLGEMISNNKLSLIFEKGTIIPAEKNLTFVTVKDQQVSGSMAIYAGDSKIANKNINLGTYKLTGIPKLSAGKGQIKVNYKIAIDGYLYITSSIHDTGLVDKRFFDLKRFELLTNR